MKSVINRGVVALAILSLTGCTGCKYISGGIVYCPDSSDKIEKKTPEVTSHTNTQPKPVLAPAPKELTPEQKKEIEQLKQRADKRCAVLMRDFQSKYDVNHPKLLSVHGNKQLVVCTIQYLAPQSYGANAPVTIILQGNFNNDVYEVRQF